MSQPLSQSDYQRLIQPDVWAYINACADFYPADAVNFSVQEQRSYYNALCQAMAQPRPAGISSQDRAVAGVPTRCYQPSARNQAATLVYFHGGGFVVGGLESHDDVCAELAETLGAELVAVDYRMAPEHRHPAALEDCLAVVRALLAEGAGPLLLAGDSAGGYLAAAVSHALRDAGRASGDMSAIQSIIGQVLIYPSLGGDRSQGSYLEQAEAPMLTRADMDYYAAIYYGSDLGLSAEPDRPLGAEDFADLPATFATTGPFDPLFDDGPAYVAKLSAAGIPARFVAAEGLPHSFLRARRSSQQAGTAWQAILEASANLLAGKAP
jgi:acetyl esterase